MEGGRQSLLHARLGRSLALMFLVMASLCYGIAELVPGRFATIDDEFFKAAGRNWAMTGRFAAPEITGFLPVGPPLDEVYFTYPPLYTFLYGVYTKYVGFGPRRSIAYDVLIHITLIWTVFFAIRAIFGVPLIIAVLAAILAIPLGTVGRPDELGIIFALAAAITLSSSLRSWRVSCSGIFLGLCACTSLGAVTFLAVPIVLNACWVHRDNVKRVDLGWLAGGAILSVTASILPILLNHPNAYHQLMAHVGNQSALLGLLTGRGWAAEYFLSRWILGLQLGYGYLALSFGLLLFAAFGLWLTKSRRKQINSHILAAMISLLALAVLLPGKFVYAWFPGVWLLVACVALGYELHECLGVRKKLLVYACGACIWMAGAAPYLRMKAILWTLPAEQRLTVNVQKIRQLIPPGVGVVTLEYWSALADRDYIYDPVFGNPDTKSVQYFVETGNGSGSPGGARGLKANYSNLPLKVIYNHLNSIPASMLGFPLSRSSYGFGAYVLKARSAVALAGNIARSAAH